MVKLSLWSLRNEINPQNAPGDKTVAVGDDKAAQWQIQMPPTPTQMCNSLCATFILNNFL